MIVFGFEITRSKKPEEIQSVVNPDQQDGSAIVDSSVTAGGFLGHTLDLDTVLKNEYELIKRYRSISMYSDCDTAVDEIVNEMIVDTGDSKLVELNLEDTKLSDAIKTKFNTEFKTILKLLKFNTNAYDLVRDWYVDGRLYHFIILDDKNIKNGIQELRFIDPRKIKKVKHVHKKKNNKGIDIVVDVDEYFVYNDKGIIDSSSNTGVKLSKDSVIFTPSGIVDKNTGMVLSFLHKAIKPVNQLKYMEDATVIYRVTRAPERRVFYIDVGSLPKLKAEQYVNDMMAKYKNKIVYDASSGEVKDDRKHMSVLDDFWMPRREGGKGTEISTLAGGANLGEISDVEYFQKKLYTALNVPLSRLQSNPGGGLFDMGRSSAISRDEVKFAKFIDRLRAKFSKLFLDALRIQLITKGIISADDWEELQDLIKFDFKKDNLYSEIKDNDLWNQRFAAVQMIDPFNGKYVDSEWISRNILRLSDEDIKDMNSRMLKQRPDQLDYAAHQGEMETAKQGDKDE